MQLQHLALCCEISIPCCAYKPLLHTADSKDMMLTGRMRGGLLCSPHDSWPGLAPGETGLFEDGGQSKGGCAKDSCLKGETGGLNAESRWLTGSCGVDCPFGIPGDVS